jgi:integrase
MHDTPTPLSGFDLIDRHLERARKQAVAQTAAELLNVGRITEDVIIVLAQTLYVAARHEPTQGPRPGADPRRRLDAYIDTEFSGSLRAATRTLAKSLLETADSLQKAGTDNAKSATLCLLASTNLVNVLRLETGQDKIQFTVRDLCQRYLDTHELGTSPRYMLQLIAGMEIGNKVASKLTADDIIEHCKTRREKVSASTVRTGLYCLRSVLKTAKDVWNIPVAMDAFAEAQRWLDRYELAGASKPRTRRPTNDELERLLAYFEEQDKRSKIPMKVLTEFALYSGRRLGEICSLRWSDVHEESRTCAVPGSKERFKLLGRAWEIVEERRPYRSGERIFPYGARSASQRYVEAKHTLGIEGLEFRDLRREAAKRLYEQGYSIEEISKVIGRSDLNSLRRDVADAAIEQAASHTDGNAQQGVGRGLPTL